MLWGLWHVRALFAEFAAGRVFTAAAARHLQIFGATVLAQAPLGPLTALAFSVGMTLANPLGERMLAIAFSINDYFALIVGGVCSRPRRSCARPRTSPKRTRASC